MKTPVIIIALVAVAIAGYLVFSAQEAATPEAVAPVENAAPETTEDATAEETTETATESVEEIVEDVVEESTDAVEGAVEAAEEAVESAVDAAEETIESTVDAAEEAVESVIEDAQETVQSAVEEATGETGADLASLFTAEGVDFDRIGELLENSDLGALQKTTLKTALDQARDNPDLLQAALDQVKSALGL